MKKKFCQFAKINYLCTRNRKNAFGSLAQLNRASDYGSEGYRFESYRSHKKNTVWLLSSTE